MATVYVNAFQEQTGGSILWTAIPISSTGTAMGAAGTGAVATEEAGAVKQTVLTLSGATLAVSDDAAAGGHASKLIYTFPKGLINIYGASINVAVTADAGLTTTSAVVGSIGTAATATDNATLLALEANVIASTAITLTASAVTFSAVSSAAVAPLDGRSTAVGLYLNFATPDAGVTGPAVLTVTGTVRISWLQT